MTEEAFAVPKAILRTADCWLASYRRDHNAVNIDGLPAGVVADALDMVG
jgi:hypothetical protein